MSLIGPRGKQGLLKRQEHNGQTLGENGAGAQGVNAERQASDASPVAAELTAEGTSPQSDKGTRGQVDKTTSPQYQKRTDYEKKGYYVGLRHQDTLDDLARALRRHGLPDDRSMIVRALIDAAGQRLESGNADWVEELASLCRQTLPGTTKK